MFNVLIMYSPFVCYLVPPRPRYSLSTLFSNNLILRSSHNVRDPGCTPIQNNRQNY